MTSRASATSTDRTSRRGFSLVELLVVIGILVLLVGLLLPAGLKAINSARESRFRFQLQSIQTALDAYKADFGEYPAVVDAFRTASAPVDFRAVQTTGAQVLARALMGPAMEAGDSADGPGFRVRASEGRVYGPYLQTDRFQIGDPARPGQLIDPARPEVWNLVLLDIGGNPILYFRSGSPTIRISDVDRFASLYQPPLGSGAPGPKPLWNLTQNLRTDGHAQTYAMEGTPSRMVFARIGESASEASTNSVRRVQAVLGDLSGDGAIDNGETARTRDAYILWSAGPDGEFGPASATPTAKDVGKIDDATTFSLD